LTAPTFPSASDLRARVLNAAQRQHALSRRLQIRKRTSQIALGFGASAVLAVLKTMLDSARVWPPTVPGHRLWRVVVAGQGPVWDQPLGFVVTLELVWFAVAVAATWAGVARGRSMLGRSGACKLAVATITPLALLVTWFLGAFTWRGVVLPLAWLEVMDTAGTGLQFHCGCALMSIAYAAGPLGAFLAMRRGSDPVSPGHAGAAFGAVAGAWAAVIYLPFCQCRSPLHVALGHVLPVVVLALLGALSGIGVLAVRPSTS
jgi:hypothetical protein